MRPNYFPLALAALFLFSCIADLPEPLPSPVVVLVEDTHVPVLPATASMPRPAPILRIAVLGEPLITNVWALFDEAAAGYWSVATQASYWPSLYRLSPLSLDLESVTARGRPASVLCDAANCAATVNLQPGLAWTDGSAFTAADVAFTVNTVVQFRLGLNWRNAYNPDVLDHAEALDEFTVRFYFKSKPTFADWYYGALQGPIVNRAYWQPRIVEALSLQPDESSLASIEELEAELAWRKADLEDIKLSLAAITPESTAYIETVRQINHMQENLIGVNNELELKRAEYEEKLAEAQTFLLTLPGDDEPTLGQWYFVNYTEGVFENRANMGTPFGNPWFGGARYIRYPDEMAAVGALLDDEVDLILTPEGLLSESVSRLEADPDISLWRNPTFSARFLAFNHARPDLADPVLHHALACVLDPQALTEILGSEATPLSGFVLDDFWRQGEAPLPCAGLSEEARLTEAIRLLKVAGYSWENEPVSAANGVGLKGPGGNVLPGYTLLTLQEDPLRERAAQFVARQAGILGLSISIQAGSLDELLYAIYSAGDYDLALLGWHLSAYPSYLCEWFLPFDQNPFAYNGSRSALEAGARLAAACETWSQGSELDVVKAQALQAQSALMEDLPLIPLYNTVRVDAYRNIRYPFANVVDGLGGLYGAPGLAIPLP